ncbi:MAG: hypothetical protein OXC44_03940 [Proteobacteria bacterium]|nr:hypothetical protein [Pseudomonadota bacterium]
MTHPSPPTANSKQHSMLQPSLWLRPFYPHYQTSFSLFETVIAVGMLAVMALYVGGIQGQVVYSLEYGQKISQGLWLARGIMAKVEYEWDSREFSELNINQREQKIDDSLFGDNASKIFNGFTYEVLIEEWKLPVIKFLTGENSPAKGESSGMIGDQIKAIFGSDIMKIAQVKVYWPEGARRGSTDLSLLLVNQKAVDKQISNITGAQASPSTTPSSPSTINKEMPPASP